MINWNKDPRELVLWEETTSACGQWQAVRVHNGVIYTQWRYVHKPNANGSTGDWEPFASVLA